MSPLVALRGVSQIRNLHRFVPGEDRPEREYSADSHVDRLIYVDRPFSVRSAEYLLDEEVRRVEVASAVRCHAAVLREVGGDELLRLVIRVLALACLRPLLVQADIVP